MTPKLPNTLNAVLEQLLARTPEPAQLAAKTAEQLLDAGYVALYPASEQDRPLYRLTEEGEFYISHLYSLVPPPPRLFKLGTPAWTPAPDVPARPGALDHKSVPSLGACTSNKAQR